MCSTVALALTHTPVDHEQVSDPISFFNIITSASNSEDNIVVTQYTL